MTKLPVGYYTAEGFEPSGGVVDTNALDTHLDNKGLSTAALNATFVRFEDEAGNPLPSRNVVIKVSATTGEIIDIVSEA